MSSRRYAIAHYEQVMALKAAGKTFEQIGKLMGISAGVACWLTKRKDILPEKLSARAAAPKSAKKAKLQKPGKYFRHDPFYNF